MAINRYFFFLLIMIVPCQIWGQTTKIRGKVLDSETKEPMPYVNIAYRNSTIGTISDFNGNFFLETRTPSDSLIFSVIGYKKYAIAVKKNVFQQVEIALVPDNIRLAEIVVVPGENPAHRLLRKIIENKPANNPSKFDSYECEIYNKIELDINNIDEDFKKQKGFKHFQFIFDYIDTSVVSGKNFLPVFITETVSDFYFQKKPKKSKEIIKGSRISGVRNDNIAQYTGQMYLDINIYDNFIYLFTKDFISPISNSGLLYYKYYLIDSAFINNQWCY